ncbi:LOW QUALITY PROTEIN: polycystin-1-like protein 1 [Lycaon pictus]
MTIAHLTTFQRCHENNTRSVENVLGALNGDPFPSLATCGSSSRGCWVAAPRQDIVKATSRAPLSAASRRSQAASDPGDHTDRDSWGPSVTITSFWNSSGPDPCRPRKCAVGPGSSVPCGLLQRSCPPAGPCRLRVRIPSCPSADDVASDVLPGTDIASTAASPGVPVRPAVSAPTSSPTAHPPTLPRSSLGHGGSASWPRPPTRCHPGAVSMHSPPDALDAADHGFPDTDARAPLSLGFRVRASPKAALCLRVDFGDSSGVQVTIYNVSRGIAVTAYHQFRKEGVYVLKALIYNDLCGPGRELGPYYVEMGPATMSVFMNSSSIRRDELLVFAGSHVDQKKRNPPRGPAGLTENPSWISAAVEGRSTRVLGLRDGHFLTINGESAQNSSTWEKKKKKRGDPPPFPIKMGELLGVFPARQPSGTQQDLGVRRGNATDGRHWSPAARDEGATAGPLHRFRSVFCSGTVVTHHFAAGPPCNVSFTCQSCAAGGQAWPSVTVQYQMQPVSVYTNGTMFATNIDITFLAVTEETAPLEFVWSFGEGPALRTTSRSIKRRFSIPQWYSVTVQAASRLGRVASEPRHIRTQRRIVANRLVSPLSALLNASVTFTCRLNFGTNVAFLWDFGDGTVGPGGSSAHHTYQREGQFTVQVRAFNDVSAVSLAKQLFVVREPCQPPPVKNMGPGKVQMWRSQPVTLGVTFESAILCDISQGLSYTWTIRTSEGWPVPLPPGEHTQTITVPGYFLELGNYTALARVQVDGSVVHSNYSVGVEVRARAPVSVISEGTQLFISRAPSVTVILSGSQSYDPDNPGATLRYHWTCTAAGAPGEPCFTASSPHSLRDGAPSLSFPASSLSNSYDQFLVTLTVSSAGRNSSEAQVFLSPRPDTALRFVRISRGSFKDALVNWNEELSLRAECDACAAGPRLSYSWDLFLVNATEGTRTDGKAPAALASPTQGGRGLKSRGRRGLAQTHVPAVPSGGRDHAGAPPAGPFPRPVGFSEPKSGGRGGADEQTAGARVAAQQRVSPSIARQSRCDGSEASRSDPVEILSRNSRQRRLEAVGLLGADSMQLPSSAPSTAASCPEPRGTGAASSQKQSPQPRVQPGPSLPGTPSLGPVDTHPLPDAGDAAFPGLARRPASLPLLKLSVLASSPPVALLLPSGALPWPAWTLDPDDHGSGASLPGADPSSSPGGGQGDGDNLLGPLRPAAGPALMVDWPKSPVGRALFRSYTASGITGHAVTIKPFSLSPGETYVVQASVASTRGLLGRAQLYLTLHPAPRDVACQVQPHRGLEAHTVFSVFCMAMRPDFRYKFSYRIGNASEHTLYHGRDTQYYFVLPAGEPSDNYKVMVSTEIMDGVGSRTLPCAVAVTVLPHFHGSLCLDEDTYNSSLKHLSTLQLMGSYTEIRNYITTITRVLSRWAAEDRSPSCGQWSRIQDALISSACGLPVADQEDMTHSVLMLRGLLRFPRKLSFRSAALILKSARAPLAQSPLSGRLAVDKGLMLELILLVSEVLEASDWEKPRNSGFLQEEGTKIISDLLLVHQTFLSTGNSHPLDSLSASTEHQLHVSAGQMEFRTRLHDDLQSSVQSLGSVQVHLPADLAAQSPVGAVQGPCYISQLMLFKKNLYPWGRGPGQIGQVVSASLFGCSSRRPVGGWRLRVPVAVEFGEEGGLDNGRTRTAFVLLRDRVNVHEFTGAATPRESLHIRIEFFRPPSGAFPVMVLVRYSAKAMNYTVRFHWLQCVVWEAGEWKPASSSPQPGVSPGKVNCRYRRAAADKPEVFRSRPRFPRRGAGSLEPPWPWVPGNLVRAPLPVRKPGALGTGARSGCPVLLGAPCKGTAAARVPESVEARCWVDSGARRGCPPAMRPLPSPPLVCGEPSSRVIAGANSMCARSLWTMSASGELGAWVARLEQTLFIIQRPIVTEGVAGRGPVARDWRSGAGGSLVGGHASAPSGAGLEPAGHDRLAPMSISRRSPNATFSASDISELQRHPENLLPSVLIVVFTILYALLVTKSRRVDCHERKKAGYIFLREDAPPGHQLYAVVMDTGFRSPTRCSAKVYIVLCGEHGLSGPRELYCPEQPLFERNSRHTFVLSVPALLGPLRRICLWHDSRGPAPAWYVSHIMVKELATGPGHSLFPAECWLAASGRDGHTAWELGSLRRGLGFWKLLYCKLEYLEDFHVWTSVYSRPSPSGFLPMARLTVAFALLCAYACLTALVTAAGQEQVGGATFSGSGFRLPDSRDPQIGIRQRIQQRARCAHLKARAMTPTHSGDLSTWLQLAWALSAPDAAAAGSLWTGLLGTLLASPGAQLLSLLFRLSQDAGGPSRVNACQSRSPLVGAAPGPNLRGGTAEAGKRREGSLVSGSSGACRRAARADGAGCPPPEREDLGADAAQRARREKGSPGAQAASSGFGGVAALRWPRALLPWSGSAAWVLCGTVSVACGLGTAFLGYRFDPTQCVRWVYLLAASVLCCVLVTQPLLVSLLALGFAWRRRHDPHFFTEALHAATKDLGPELEARARPHPPHCASQKEEVLAVRQRARHLRRARPPSAAQLSAVRQKLRRQIRTRRALRGASSASGGLGSVADWWGWTLTTLLDGLHGGGAPPARPPGTQREHRAGRREEREAPQKMLKPGSSQPAGGGDPKPQRGHVTGHAASRRPSVLDPQALGGTCYLLGSLVIRRLRWPSGSAGQLPSRAPALPEDPPPEVGGPDGAPVTEPATPGDSRGCGSREPWELSLGSTRPAAHAALSGLRAGGWIDGGTSAVSVHFVLYNCPTRLLSSVALHAELLPTGGLALAPLVESVAAFHSDSGPWHRLALPELAFLVLSLTQSCRAAQEGVHSYWGEPGSWLELAIAGAGLARYAASCHLATVAGAVTDRLHRGHFRGSMDLSLAASWSQRVMWLQGTLSFLLTLKCVHLVSIRGTTASCSFLMWRSLASAFAAAVRGLPGRRAQAVPSRHLLEGDAAYAGLSRDSPPPESSQPRMAGRVLPRRQEWGTNVSDTPDSGPAPGDAPAIARSPLASCLLPLPHRIVPRRKHTCRCGCSDSLAPMPGGSRAQPRTGRLLIPRIRRARAPRGMLATFWGAGGSDLVPGDPAPQPGCQADEGAGELGPGSRSLSLQLAGVLALAAHSHLRAVPPGTLTDFSRGPRSRLSRSDLQAPAWCCGALFMVMSTAWLGMLRGSFTTLAQKRKSFQSQSVVRLADVTAYVRTEALAWLGLERPQQEEAEMVESHNYYLDDVSDLLDELLSKIHALSDSLQLPLPEQQFCDMREARAKGHSSAGISA